MVPVTRVTYGWYLLIQRYFCAACDYAATLADLSKGCWNPQRKVWVMHQSIPAAPIPPPGQLRGICAPCQSRGWGISKFGAARGSGICLSLGYPWPFDTHVVSDSKSKHGRIYRKGPAVQQIGSSVKVEDWTNLKKFSDFMHFFIAYQGTTRAIRERSMRIDVRMLHWSRIL